MTNSAQTMTRKMAKRSMSSTNFDSMGQSYTAIRLDHSYHIKHGLKFGSEKMDLGHKDKGPSSSYMDQVISLAKKRVDPRKYNR